MSNPSSSEKLTEVVCLVLIDQSNNLLATQRSLNGALGGKWEFPGGKVEDGENHESALRRELREELCIEVGTLSKLSPVIHRYKFGTIRLWPYLSQCKKPLTLTLVEHSNHLWVSLAEATKLDWAPADLPILDQLEEILEK